MKHSRRIMFVHSSQPLVETSVRLLGADGEHELVTDGDGQVYCELEEGIHTAKVHAQNNWVECAFQINGKQSLFVVDINTHASGSFNQITGSFSALSNQILGDRYVFEEVIGRGGMGVVVRAVDKLLNRTVAIKMLNDEFLENQEAQQIFLEEARSIATLTHPNLVAIYDVTMLDGRAMIVFEHIEGEDLDSVFAEHGRISECGVARIAIQLTRALKYLHSQGILHRDIKPSNVLMQPDGMLKIIDFGLARPLEQLALKGTRVRGTPAYMAPEQIEGSQLLAATDIYQLGVSLYELLTGTLPFSSGNMAYSHVHLDPPRIEELIELHEPRLANLIHACLFKLPADRPSAEVLFQSFQSLYAANAMVYDQGTSVIIPNQDALFSETVELSIPEFRPSTQRTSAPNEPTLDHISTTTSRFTTGSHPGMDAPHFDDDDVSGSQRLLIIAAGLVLLLFGLGSVILMLVQEDDTSTPEITQEVSSREENPSNKTLLDTPTPDKEIEELATPKDSPQEKSEPSNAVATSPVDEQPVVDRPDDNSEKTAEEATSDEPRTPTKTRPAVVTSRKVKEPITQAKSEPSSEADEKLEVVSEDPKEPAPPVNEEVVATTPAPASEDPSKTEATSKDEPATTRRVIRKKIIRKVVRKKSNPSTKETTRDDQESTTRAPVSF